MMLILDPTPVARGLARKKVEVVNCPDGRFAVQFNGMALGFKAQQAAYPARQQRGHGARQRPPNNLEAPAGSAVEGAGPTPRCCRGCGLRQRDRGLINSAAPLVFRYVTELPPAKPGHPCRGQGGF
jgi:hypothetical protein